MKHVSFYREKYPRPQFVRESFLDLNEEWKFDFDDEDSGEREKWFDGHAYARRIRVPFSYQTPASGIGERARHDVVWYEREICAQVGAGNRLLLHFEGVDHVAQLWVNGKYVGSHTGGYTRFTFDVTDYLEGEKNRITVRAEDHFDAALPRGKQRWQEESYACFYVETNGIWKSVWAEIVPAVHIEKIRIIPQFDTDSALFAYEIAGDGKGLALQTVVTYDGEEIFDVQERLGGSRLSFSHSMISKAHYFKICSWTPECPQLYEVRAVLKGDGGILDEVRSYFGMRRIDGDGGRFIVNHVPGYFRGVLDQGYWPDTHLTPPDGESLLRDVMLAKELGFNGIRKHQKIEDERFYYYCDAAGLYVTCEMPSNYEFTQKGCEYLVREWMEAVDLLANHPAVVCWVPFNESWGVSRIYANRRQQDFTRGICALTRALDGEARPVISNDGWEHTDSDIIALHNYAENGGQLRSMQEDMERVLGDLKVGDCLPRRVFAKGVSYRGQPVMLSEYGGIAFDTGEGWGYGRLVRDEEEYLARLADLTETVRKIKLLSGYCYTQLTDVQQEVNGLLTADRAYKADPQRLRNIFSR